MKEEQGKKLDPNDPAIPAKPDKPSALADEDLDRVAGGVVMESKGITVTADSGSTKLADAPKPHIYPGSPR